MGQNLEVATNTELSIKDLTVSLPQGELFAREWTPKNAAAEPIILMHDSVGCVELWRDFPELLARQTNRRVLAFDRLGFGKSAGRGAELPLTFVNEEADVFGFQVRDALEIDKFIVFGHSIGGSMALVIGALYPDSCLAVISESAQVFVDEQILKAITESKNSSTTAEQLERLRKYHGSNTDWVLRSWYDTWFHPEFAAWNLKEELPKIKCPVLALQGEGDEYCSLRHPELIKGIAGGVTTEVIVKECGHVPHREKPDEVIAAVKKFLAG